MRTKQILRILPVIFTLSSAWAQFGERPEQADDHKEKKTVVEIVAGNKDFSTLVTAIKAAGLAEALSGEGPFTIFVPANSAFVNFGKETVASLLKPKGKKALTAILKYHVIPGKVMSADFKSGEVKTLLGKKLPILVEDGKVTVDDATVIMTDFVASNGVIHVIDRVIWPSN